jgi:RNA polymerase sigma-70 factor (ECF subfamily)
MNQSDEFVELISGCQGRLFAYIAAALGDADRANEVLQETNLVIWRKSDDFEIGTNFDAWVFRIASFQVMAYRQRQLRDKLLFDQNLVENISCRAQQRSELYEARLKRLDRCIEKLPARSREVIRRRYCAGDSLQKIADDLQQTQNAIGQLLFRVKKKLIECVSQERRETGINVT